jgi:hypothetical protein
MPAAGDNQIYSALTVAESTGTRGRAEPAAHAGSPSRDVCGKFQGIAEGYCRPLRQAMTVRCHTVGRILPAVKI